MPNGCKTLIKNMDEEEVKEADAERKEEKEGQGYENSWEQLPKRTQRLLKYDETITDKDGWARLTTISKRGLRLTIEKMKELCKGKGGGRRIRFGMAEQTEEARMRLLTREEKKKKYTPMEE